MENERTRPILALTAAACSNVDTDECSGSRFRLSTEKTDSTAGNLSVQLDKLANAGYITMEKGFVGKKPKRLAE